jgi:hypothetical protein
MDELGAPVAVSPAPTLAPAFDAAANGAALSPPTSIVCGSMPMPCTAMAGWLRPPAPKRRSRCTGVRLESRPHGCARPLGAGRAGAATACAARDLRPGTLLSEPSMFGRGLGRAARAGPVRLLGFAPDVPLAREDPNRPAAAARQASLVLTAASGPGRARTCATADLFLGPGLPTAARRAARACYFPAGAAGRAATMPPTSASCCTAPGAAPRRPLARKRLRGLYGGLSATLAARALDLMASHDSHTFRPARDARPSAGMGHERGSDFAANPRLGERVVAGPQYPPSCARLAGRPASTADGVRRLDRVPAGRSRVRCVAEAPGGCCSPSGVLAIAVRADRWFPSKADRVEYRSRTARSSSGSRLALAPAARGRLPATCTPRLGAAPCATGGRRVRRRTRACADPLFVAFGYR